MTNSDAIKWIDSLREAIGDPLNGTLWHYEQPLAEIIDLLKKQYWTPCSKELPKENVPVLLGVKYRDAFKVFVTSRVDYNYWTGLGRDIKGEMRWKPLPEPYGGERDDRS